MDRREFLKAAAALVTVPAAMKFADVDPMRELIIEDARINYALFSAWHDVQEIVEVYIDGERVS